MKNLDSALVCIELRSVALGYRVLQSITADSGVRVLEASAVASGFLILALGAPQVLRAAMKRVRDLDIEAQSELLALEVFEDVGTSVLEALYALPHSPLEESLVVLESKTVCELLQGVLALTRSSGMKVIEIKLARSGLGGGFAYLTGPRTVCAQAADELRSVDGFNARVEVIEAPTLGLRSFFELSGA